MSVQTIVKLKNEGELEKAFNKSIHFLTMYGIDVSNKKPLVNAFNIDKSNAKFRLITDSKVKRKLTSKEQSVIDMILEAIPLAVMYDDIVLVNLLRELMKIAIQTGKSRITPLAYIGCGYVKINYYDDIASGLDYLKKAQRTIDKRDDRISILVIYLLCGYFSHIIEDLVSIEYILIDSMERCDDAVLVDLMNLELAKTIILEGGQLPDIFNIKLQHRNDEKQNLLEVYGTYAKALIGTMKVENDDFLVSMTQDYHYNKFVAQLLTYMYYVHCNDTDMVKKYSKLVLKVIKHYKNHPISYQYFVYRGYHIFRTMNGVIKFGSYFKYDEILENLEFFSTLKDNELGNIWLFFKGVKQISVGNKIKGENKLKRSIKQMKNFNNMKDYAMFSHLFALYKKSRNRKADYDFSQMQKGYISYGANMLLGQMAYEKENITIDMNSDEMLNLNMMSEFKKYFLETSLIDKSIKMVIKNNYDFAQVAIFNKKDDGIRDDISVAIEKRGNAAVKSIKYVFKSGKKLIVSAEKGNKIRSIDNYLLENKDIRILILPFEGNDKVLYIEDNKDIKYSTELELENFVYKINKYRKEL